MRKSSDDELTHMLSLFIIAEDIEAQLILLP